MEGRLDETDFYSLRERERSDQSALTEWMDTDETLVAVVSCPRDTGIDELCDEHRPELGMPERALSDFWNRRAGYRTNSAVDEPHNKAYEDSQLEEVYRQQLRTSEALRSMRELAIRLTNGENITLVCFEEDGKRCHRHLLKERIEEEAERVESSKFDFVVS